MPPYALKRQKSDSQNDNKNYVKHEDDVDQVCTECGLRSMRIKQSEGILVCMECGVVERERMINFGQNEVKNFGSENGAQNMQRVGASMRLDDINKMGTELSWGPTQKQRGGYSNMDPDNRNKHAQERRQADIKDFFVKYFKEM